MDVHAGDLDVLRRRPAFEKSPISAGQNLGDGAPSFFGVAWSLSGLVIERSPFSQEKRAEIADRGHARSKKKSHRAMSPLRRIDNETFSW